MKIIAEAKGGFLIEATADELSNLMGYASDFYRTYDRREGNEKFRIGDKIPIKKMYDRLYGMANMSKELTEISAKLRAASDFVNTALPTIQRVNKSDGEEEAAS